jgi:hypothetical protein
MRSDRLDGEIMERYEFKRRCWTFETLKCCIFMRDHSPAVFGRKADMMTLADTNSMYDSP